MLFKRLNMQRYKKYLKFANNFAYLFYSVLQKNIAKVIFFADTSKKCGKYLHISKKKRIFAADLSDKYEVPLRICLTNSNN